MCVKSRREAIKEQASQVVFIPGTNHHNRRVYGMRSITDLSVNYETTLYKPLVINIEGITAGLIECECSKVTATGMESCRGNSQHTVCRHSMATLTKAANDKGQSIQFFDKFIDALRYSNLGGKLVKMVSKQGSGVVWGVFK